MQARAFISRMRASGCVRVDQETELTHAVINGPWTDTHKREMGAVVNVLVEATAAKRTRRSMQRCLRFEKGSDRC